MKKFKHKITGEIVTELTDKQSKGYKKYQLCHNAETIPARLVENSNDWEEIIKEYQILSFKHKHGSIFSHSYCKNKTKYCQTIDGSEYEEDYLLKDSDMHIYSVKRLSDGEIFTIGDKVRLKRCDVHDLSNPYKEGNIESFICNENGIIALYKSLLDNPKINIFHLENLSNKLKKPLFTTEDGVEIFQNDIFQNMDCYSVVKEKFELGGKVDWRNEHPYAHALYFSTKEAAIEYIIMNKPCLSLNDFYFLSHYQAEKERTFNKLKELVKSKLNL